MKWFPYTSLPTAAIEVFWLASCTSLLDSMWDDELGFALLGETAHRMGGCRDDYYCVGVDEMALPVPARVQTRT